MAFYPELPPGIGISNINADDVPAVTGEITDDGYTSSSGILVNERFGQARTLAEEAWATAIEFLNTISSGEYNIPWTHVALEDVDPVDISAVKPSPVTLVTTDMELPFFTAVTPEMEDVDTDIGDVPEFLASEPLISIPDPPDVAWPIFTKDAPPMSDPTYPTSPEFDLPGLPALTDITVPSPPDFNQPSFDAVMPVFDATPPETMFVWNEAEYSSDVLDALATKLLDGVASGGTGLSVETEQAIYDRAKSRQATENEAKYLEVLNFHSSRGHSEPPGALNSALLEIRVRILQVLEDLNNDILVNQSKLAQENTHFMISTGIAYEKALMDYTNQVQQRAFDAAKYVTEHAILLYDIKVKAYLGQLEAYKTYAQIFESRIRAEIAKAEFYRAQIEGLKLNVEVQQAAVSLYRAQIEGINSLIGLYTAQMQAVSIQAQVDKTKIDAYGVEVQAFAAKSGALVSQYNAYQAHVAGEAEKAKLFLAQAQAYTARVGGYKAKADVELSRVQIEVEKLKAQMSVYLGQIDKYKSDIQAVIAEAEILSKEQGHRVDIYKADSTQYGIEVDAMVKNYLGRIEELKANADLQIKEADTSTRALIAQYDLGQKSLDSGARIAAQLAASALGSVSASAHLQFGESRSDQRSYSAGWNAHTGVTESHSHDETKGTVTTNRSESHVYNPGTRMF